VARGNRGKEREEERGREKAIEGLRENKRKRTGPRTWQAKGTKEEKESKRKISFFYYAFFSWFPFCSCFKGQLRPGNDMAVAKREKKFT